MIFAIALVIITPATPLAPPGRSLRHKLGEKITSYRSQCWTYSVETASDFLAGVLTHPKVEPLIVNAITMAIDKWVDKNSDDFKGSAMAMRDKVTSEVRENIMATVPGKVGGKLRDTAVKISGGRKTTSGGDKK